MSSGFDIHSATRLVKIARGTDKKGAAVEPKMGGLTKGSNPQAWTGGEPDVNWNQLAKFIDSNCIPKPTQIRLNSSKGAEALSKRTGGLAESEKYCFKHRDEMDFFFGDESTLHHARYGYYCMEKRSRNKQ